MEIEGDIEKLGKGMVKQMIYLTGDTHGHFGRVASFCERMKTTTEDVMVVLGDAGINYYLGKRDEELKKFLSTIPVTFFCIHGNHEQRPYAIKSYKEQEWRGGTVYVEPQYPTILFAKDGEIYDFDGKKGIAIGGAYSVDKFYRLARHFAWYDNEQPSEQIKNDVESQLEKCGWKVDYVFSHTTPVKYEPVETFLPSVDQSTVDKSTEIWLGEIEARLEYERWFCGHYHIEKKVDRLQIMYEDYAMLAPAGTENG